MADRDLNAIVTQKTEHAPGLMTIRTVPDGWTLPDFTPGQFTVLGLPRSAPRCPEADAEPAPAPGDGEKTIVRAYSIASSSVAREYLEFYISLVRSGELTPRLFNLEIGDRLWLSPRFSGYFTLEEVPPEANVVLIATGTGLAPYMSMVRTVLSPQEPRRFAVIHGAYHSWDLGYHSELVMLQRLARMFSYFPVISEPAEEPVPWKGRTGFVQALWEEGVIEKQWGLRPAPEHTHVFLCGHPLMIESMLQILEREGFTEHTRRTPGQIHLEKYW
jgi:ferredoxin--NADP+ reductase